MEFSAWITLIVTAGVLFGGLFWSVAIAMRKKDEQ